MNGTKTTTISGVAMATAVAIAAAAPQANADEPCGDFGECKVLIEINSTDGDVGFHFLGDADDLRAMRIRDPEGGKVFQNRAHGPLREQRLTETFGESSEPLCWFDEEEIDDPDDVVTLRDFLNRFDAGVYVFEGMVGEEGKIFGETTLTYDLPAAPQDVDFNGATITWSPGNDLGNCAPASAEQAEENGVDTIWDIVNEGLIPDPSTVPVAAWEVVMEPDVEDGDLIGDEVFSIRVSGSVFAVDVPALYLAQLPADTPVKIEIGAIGFDDNAVFTEEDGFCINEDEGCEDEEDEEEE